LKAHTTSVENTAVGRRAGKSITTGANNTAVGVSSLPLVTTGCFNTAIGQLSGGVTTTGICNLAVGRDTEHSANNTTREIVIGIGEVGKGSNTAFLDGSSGVFNKANTTAWDQTSDRRIKKNIVDNTTGLDKINQIKVRNFEYRTIDEITDFENAKTVVVKKEGIQVGAIAQELEEILPELVTTQTTGVKTVSPDKLTWYMVNAVQELTEQNKEMKAEIEELKKK